MTITTAAVKASRAVLIRMATDLPDVLKQLKAAGLEPQVTDLTNIPEDPSQIIIDLASARVVDFSRTLVRFFDDDAFPNAKLVILDSKDEDGKYSINGSLLNRLVNIVS